MTAPPPGPPAPPGPSGSADGPARRRPAEAPAEQLAALIATARVFAIPMGVPFRGITVREGVLVHGPAGWAEFAPFLDYDDAECVPWWRAAVESATVPWPAALRTEIPLNATVPVVSPDRAAAIVAASGCRTAKVKVADPWTTLAQDADRLAAVRDALGPDGHVRIDANGAWTPDEAVAAIGVLDRAAGGLQYAEQPCASLADLAAVRRRVGVPIAADESIRHAADPLRVAVAGAADIAVIKVAPLGGVRAALAVARAAALPVVVSSAVDTVVGIAAGLALAAALPDLPYACGLGTAALLTGDVGRPLTGRAPGSLTALPRPPVPDAVLEFPADRSTTARWLDRLHRVAALARSAQQVDRAEHVDQADLAQHADPAHHVNSDQHLDPAQHADQAGPARHADPAQHAHPAQHGDQAERAERADPSGASGSPGGSDPSAESRWPRGWPR